MSATDTAYDLFTPTLDDLRSLSADLNAALGEGKEWSRLDGCTFVSASRDRGRTVVVGNGGGWRALQVPETGPAEPSEPFHTAAEAMAALPATAPSKPTPKPTPSKRKP